MKHQYWWLIAHFTRHSNYSVSRSVCGNQKRDNWMRISFYIWYKITKSSQSRRFPLWFRKTTPWFQRICSLNQFLRSHHHRNDSHLFQSSTHQSSTSPLRTSSQLQCESCREIDRNRKKSQYIIWDFLFFRSRLIFANKANIWYRREDKEYCVSHLCINKLTYIPQFLTFFFMRFILIPTLFLTSCSWSTTDKTLTPTPAPNQELKIVESGSIDIWNQSVIEISGSLVQPIR